MNLIYTNLNKVGFLKKSYSLKFLFIAFLGIHIPLIGVIVYVVNNKENALSTSTIIILTLILTLIAAIITLSILRSLLTPLHLSKLALENYLYKNKLPDLPLEFVDEAGTLMSLIQKTLNAQDALIKEKQEITTLVSHNLRTPLNQIKGLCEIMKYDDADKSLYIEKISKIADIQLDALSDLLNQLMHKDLDLSLSDEECNIGDIILQEIEMVEASLKSKNIEIIFDKPKKAINTKINKNKISLIIQNLISNAIKFSFEDSKIHIGIKNTGGRLEIFVKDNGIGFDDAYQKLLFKDARNLGRKGTKDEPSVGLGLHLSKRTINQLGGEIKAHSDGINKGATFTIIL